MKEDLKCWKCEGSRFMETPTYLEPLTRSNGDKLIFTVCQDCWEVNEFANGKPVRIVLIPVEVIRRELK